MKSAATCVKAKKRQLYIVDVVVVAAAFTLELQKTFRLFSYILAWHFVIYLTCAAAAAPIGAVGMPNNLSNNQNKITINIQLEWRNELVARSFCPFSTFVAVVVVVVLQSGPI